MEEFNSIATETINAAYEYNDGVILSRNNIPMIAKKQTNNSTIIHKSSSKAYYYYSMEPIDILKRAGVDSSAGFIPSMQGRLARAAAKSGEDLRQEATLPSRSEIVSMYGNSSHIVGLERCEEFRDLVSPENRLMGPAGMFNSATNLLNKLLKLNCVNEQRLKQARTKGYRGGGNTGMLLQAPWGKHNPAPWRLHHLAAVGSKGVNQTEFLPVVMIKDPITWMASMCRHSYEARWRHVKEHCPNLVPNKYDRKRKLGEGTMGVQVKFATRHYGDEPLPDPHNKTFIRYDSLVHLWNTWYNQWYNASFPRLIVRFEDLMLHAEETVSKVCECGGGTMQETFRYVEQSAKGQGECIVSILRLFLFPYELLCTMYILTFIYDLQSRGSPCRFCWISSKPGNVWKLYFEKQRHIDRPT